jgi:signal peptidase II
LRILFVTLIVVILDQVTKFLVKGLKVEWLGIDLKGMPYGSSKPLFGEIVRITFIENPGMAFGIDIGPKLFLTIFTIAASVFIFFYIYKHRNDGILIRLSLALILAGAIGNLIDRTFYGVIYNYAPYFKGKVVDFVQVEFWDFTFLGRTYTTWPIWNIADASVSIGFLIILLFHNRIFKHDEVQPEDSGAVSPPIDGEYPAPLAADTNGVKDKSVLDLSADQLKEEERALNNIPAEKLVQEPVTQEILSGTSQIEDTTKNADAGPGGTDKDTD